MAVDNTPPRLRLIVTIAIIVVITLIGLDFVFKSYFAFMTDEAQREKLAPRTDLAAQLAAEHAAIEGAKVPMSQAFAQLKASRGELIEPKPSDDLGAMTGWSKLPKQAPLPALGADAHAVTPSADGGANAADGGAMATDGGALAADGGAPGAPGAAGDGGASAGDGGSKPGVDDKKTTGTRPAPTH